MYVPGEAAFAIVVPGGRFSAHGTPSGHFAAIDPAEAQRRGVTVRGIADVQLTDIDLKRLTVQALTEAAARRITPVIGQTVPLTRAADAHSAIEDRAVFGKTLLLPCFSGDSLYWSRTTADIEVAESVTWFSIAELAASLSRVVGTLRFDGCYRDTVNLNHLRRGNDAPVAGAGSAGWCARPPNHRFTAVRCEGFQTGKYVADPTRQRDAFGGIPTAEKAIAEFVTRLGHPLGQ